MKFIYNDSNKYELNNIIILFKARVPNRPLFQRTVLYFNQLYFIFIEPIKDAKCPLFLRF